MNPLKHPKYLRETTFGSRISSWLIPVYWLVSIVYFELLLHLVAFSTLSVHAAYVLGFSAVFACGIGLVLSFLKEKAHFVMGLILTVLLTFFYGSQMVYNFVFKSLYSVASLQQGGAAVTSFWRETLMTMWENIFWLVALMLPVVVLCLLWKFCRKAFSAPGWKWRGVLAVLTVALQLVSLGSLRIGGTGYFTDYYFYYNEATTTDQATERFGLLTAFRLDLFQVDSFAEEEASAYYAPQTTAAAQEDVPQEEKTEYNVLEIDFDALNGKTQNETIQALNNYCASLTGTNKNEYTGMLSDYNLILLCAESFDTGAIHQEYTPNLYRLANEGFVFNNFYNTYPDTTTDGEYTLCTGLYPDTTRSKSLSSFYASRNSYLPFCLGNAFQEQRGFQSYGYHNYEGSYYGRDETHSNMGYSMKFAKDGMTFTSTWPASDLEMMEQSVDDYISSENQFHAYYMTFSGHYKYDRHVNFMVERNFKQVEKAPFSYHAKCYVSCNIELDKAVGYLMQRLEEAGVAEKTAIVLVGDHYPYGLSEKEYSELVGYEIDPFTKFKSTLIFWAGGLEETIQVDTYCSTADILPTILNLWGIDYDSRMLAGTDVFSDGEHVAILRDRSFFTDKVWMNANRGEIRYLVDESELPASYVENMIKLVETRYSISADILNTAYYNFVFGKEDVQIENSASW